MNYEQQEATIVAAQESLKAGRAALLNKAGGRVYSDEEHNRRAWELDKEFRQTLARASQAAADQAAEAEAVLSQGPENGLLPLTTAELERANQLRAFIAEDAATLGLNELVDRVDAALRSGDRPTVFLYHRAVSARLAGMPTDRYGLRESSRDPHERRLLTTLETLRDRLNERLIDPVKQARREREQAAAREKRSKAVGLIGSVAATSILHERYGPRPAAGTYLHAPESE